jgi:hypothetical protein
MRFTTFGLSFAVLWSALIVWVVRAFWLNQPRDAPSGKIWGTLVNGSTALIVPTFASLPDVPYWLEVIFFAFIGFPLTTVGGYYIDLVIRSFIQRQSRK